MSPYSDISLSRLNPPVPFILSTPQGDVEVAVQGDGIPVLCLHGAMGGWDQSFLLARALGVPNCRYISVSRPGYLGTPISSGLSSKEQAELYANILESLHIEKTWVVAISGGGPSAIAFALRYPNRCKGLVLISTCGSASTTPIPLHFRIMMKLARIPYVARKLGEKADQNIDQAVQRSIIDPTLREKTLQDTEVRTLLINLIKSTSDRMDRRIDGTLNDIHISKTFNLPLEDIQARTLVVHGTADQLLPFERHGKVLGEKIPNAESLVLEGGEHTALFTHLQIVRNEIKNLMMVSTVL